MTRASERITFRSGAGRALAGLLVAFGLLAFGCRAEPRPLRGVVLIVLDTLRADHLGCYGYSRRPTSPRLDELAKQAVLFESAISHAPWTIASVTSILSGFPDTRAFDDGLQRSLVEPLTAAGVRTAAFTEGGYFTATFGFDRGFEEFHEEHYLFGGGIERTVEAALEWLGNRPREPFFLLVHSYEAHMPYLRTAFAAELPPGRIGEHYTEEVHAALESGALTLDAADLERLVALYDGGVQACDRGVGRLLDGLEALGLRGDTAIVLTSDHGEELAEGRFPCYAGDHGHALFDELVHVPLLVADPRREPRRVRAQVRSMDVLPTVLELLNVVVPDDVEGRSLVPLLDGRDEPTERPARGGSTEEGPEREFLRRGGFKLVRRLEEPEPGSPFEHVPELQLYDLVNDPGERRNLAAERPELLRPWLEALEAEPGHALEPESLDIPPDLAERLRALGY